MVLVIGNGRTCFNMDWREYREVGSFHSLVRK